MSGFRDDLGAARQRQDDLERENAELKAELEKERTEREKERKARPAPPPPQAAQLPRWIFGALAGTVAASGLVAYLAVRAASEPHEDPLPPATVATTHPPPPVDSVPPSFAQPGTPVTRDAWVAVALPTKVPLHAIAGGLDVIYAVGDGGTILRHHRAEDVWSQEASGTTATLRSVSVMGGQVMAAGDGGTIVALPNQEATAFHARASGTKKNLRAIDMTSLGLFVAGEDGTLLRGNWINEDPLHAEKLKTTKHLNAICAAMADVWIAGDGGTLLHASLTGIEEVDSGTTENLHALVCDASKVIAVGDHGTITQRSDPRAKFVVSHDGTADWLAITSYYGMNTWVAVGRGAAVSESWAAKRGGLSGDVEGIAYTTLGTYAVGTAGLFRAP